MDPEEEKKLQEFLKTVDKSTFNRKPFVKIVPKPWGYELIFTPEHLPYTGKIMHVKAGTRQSLQIHDKKRETYYLASGRGGVLIENENSEMVEEEFETGKGYTTELGQKHRIYGITDCDVWEVSTPESGNTYRLDDDYARPTETDEMRKDPNRGWNQ